MRALFLSLLLIVSAPFAVQADDRDLRIHEARNFVNNSGMWDAMQVSMGDLGALVAAEFDGISPQQSEEIRSLVNDSYEQRKDELRMAVAGVHADLLSLTDLENLNAMFRSPLGRELAAHVATGQPVTEELMADIAGRLSPADRALSEALFADPAAENWEAVQPRLLAEVEQVSMQFGQNLVGALLPEIRAIVLR